MQYMGFTAEERKCELEDTDEEITQNATPKDTDIEIMKKRLRDTEGKVTPILQELLDIVEAENGTQLHYSPTQEQP